MLFTTVISSETSCKEEMTQTSVKRCFLNNNDSLRELI